MSLINDALKRATTERPAPSHPGDPTPLLQPVETAPAARTSPVLVGGVLLLGVGAIGIAAALWFNGRTPVPVNAKVQPQPAEVHAPAPANVAASGTPQVSVAKNPIQRATTQLQVVAARNEVPPANTPAPQPIAGTTTPTAKLPTAAPKSAAVTTIATAPSTSATAPKLTPAPSPAPAADKPVRLQSIFYRLKSPTVIINGKTLGIGDSADGIQVVSIQRTSVEVVQNGKYRTLTLQD